MASTMCVENCSDPGILYEMVTDEIWVPWNAAMYYFEYQPWVFSLLGSVMVGLAGIFPLLVIPLEAGANLKSGAGADTLKMLLSFAVGGLLGDVFLHLLPEAWANGALNKAGDDNHPSMACGLWVLAGFLVFIIVEKMFCGENDTENDEEMIENEDPDVEMERTLNNNVQEEPENNNCLKQTEGTPKNELLKIEPRTNGFAKNFNTTRSHAETNWGLRNGHVGDNDRLKVIRNTEFPKSLAESNGFLRNSSRSNDGLLKNASHTNDLVKRSSDELDELSGHDASLNGFVKNAEIIPSVKATRQKTKPKHISGYLNLVANSIDNFTHGLAVGGSFLVSFRLGALTTLAILVHEIPHEVGDFAILLKSGFSRWDAARAQMLTAGGGIFGALVAVLCAGGGVEARTSWILPFTAGGFLHIGLVTILPELLKESNPKESFKQLGALLIGITLMALLTTFCD